MSNRDAYVHPLLPMTQQLDIRWKPQRFSDAGQETGSRIRSPPSKLRVLPVAVQNAIQT